MARLYLLLVAHHVLTALGFREAAITKVASKVASATPTAGGVFLAANPQAATSQGLAAIQAAIQKGAMEEQQLKMQVKMQREMQEERAKMQSELHEQQLKMNQLQQMIRLNQKNPGQAQTSLQHLLPTNALVATKAEVVSAGTATVASSGGVAKPKGYDQCMHFARYIKAQQVTGVEFVRMWTSSCEPAVISGRATEQYRTMCSSLEGAVQPYASQGDYDETKLCDSVLTVFHDSTATMGP